MTKRAEKKTSSRDYQRKSWLKLYANEWLTGSTRFELTPAERSVFIDWLALARVSKCPGVVCAGVYDNGCLKGYPRSFLCGTLVISEELLESTIEKCVKYEKVVLTRDDDDYIIIEIVNFKRYQDEYMRQKKYRTKAESPEDFKERYDGRFKG